MTYEYLEKKSELELILSFIYFHNLLMVDLQIPNSQK